MRFRLATQGDAQALLDIYAQYIDTPITFECVLPTLRLLKKELPQFKPSIRILWLKKTDAFWAMLMHIATWSAKLTSGMQNSLSI